MCLQNMQRSTGYVKTKNGQVPVLVSGVRTCGVKGRYMQTTEVKIRGNNHQNTNIPRSNPNISLILY